MTAYNAGASSAVATSPATDAHRANRHTCLRVSALTEARYDHASRATASDVNTSIGVYKLRG